MNDKPIKNILYVENGIGYGGAVICLRHLIRHLDRRRFHPLVVTGRNGALYQDITHDAEWHHIADRHVDLIGLQRGLSQITWLNHIPGVTSIVNQILARSDDVFNFLPFFVCLFCLTWRSNIDLIHTNNEPLCNRAALLTGKLLGIPTISHVRGEQSGSWLMRWAYGLPEHFISVSHWLADSMQSKLQVPADKISVIYDGIALDDLDINADGAEFRNHHQVPPEAFAVGLVGLLIPWKGQTLFLDAAILLRDKIPKLKMLIVGGTPDDCSVYEAELRQRVIDQQLQDIVSFTGHVANMAAAYKGLDVVVSTSTSPEPLGTVVIEAMAIGRPLIGPNHGGAAEMLELNQTGLLFQPNDAVTLAKQIERFYQDVELRTRLGKNARKQALATFSIETHTDKIQALYDRFLS